MDRPAGSFIEAEDGGISPNLSDEAMKKRTEAQKTDKTKEVKKDVKK